MRQIAAIACLASLVLAGCKLDTEGPLGEDEGLTNTYAYESDGPYASVLKGCISANQVNESCRLSKLPTLGMEVGTPNIDQVMERLVVSHEWMGQRFRDLLGEMPEDMLVLLGGVTAVVIDDDIRPSYYWNLTGAIYLDPANLWLTVEERDVINTKADYRAGYADPMSFRGFTRYHQNGVDIYNYALAEDGSRQLSHIVKPMATLLFHELAHANDLLPTSAYDSIDTNSRIFDVSSNLHGSFPSTILSVNQGLQSDEMFRIAGILFRGVSPTAADTQISAMQVGAYFEPDGASDEYGYTSQYEDLAMLFEESMMKLHFNVDRDLAYVNAPQQVTSCDSYTIGWGVRNRIATSQVTPRAQWVTEQILPQRDYSNFFSGLGQPRTLPVGAGWCESATPQQAKLFSKGIIENNYKSPKELPPFSDHRPYRIMF